LSVLPEGARDNMAESQKRQRDIEILQEELTKKRERHEEIEQEKEKEEKSSFEYNLNVIKNTTTQEVALANASFSYIRSGYNNTGAKSRNKSIRRAQIISPFMQSVLICLQRVDERLKACELD
jgi:hypothetical protein